MLGPPLALLAFGPWGAGSLLFPDLPVTVNTDPQRVLVRLKQPDTQWALTNSERALHVVDYWAGHCNATVNVSKVVGAMYTPVLRSLLEAHV